MQAVSIHILHVSSVVVHPAAAPLFSWSDR